MDEGRNRTRVVAMTVGSFLAFFLFGVLDVLKGSTLSAVLEEMRFSYSQGGFIVMAAYLGFVVATLATGYIAFLGGKKTILVIAALVWLVGITGYSMSHSLSLFVVSFFFIGFGCGSVELGANYIIVDVQTKNPGFYLNLLASFYGLGSMAAPLYAGRVFNAGLTWRDAYHYALVAPLVLLLFFAAMRYPVVAAAKKAEPGLREMLRSAFTGKMCWIYVLVFAYVGAEVTIATWLVEYLLTLHRVPMEDGSTWLSMYFAGIMIGRFLGSFVVEKIGYMRSMAMAVTAGIVCVALGVYGPGSLLILLPVTGLFYSIVLPTATALIASFSKQNIGSILGLFFCFVGLGGVVGPWFAGVVSDHLGLRPGMMVSALFCVLMLVSLQRIHAAMRREAH